MHTGECSKSIIARSTAKRFRVSSSIESCVAERRQSLDFPNHNNSRMRDGAKRHGVDQAQLHWPARWVAVIVSFTVQDQFLEEHLRMVFPENCSLHFRDYHHNDPRLGKFSPSFCTFEEECTSRQVL